MAQRIPNLEEHLLVAAAALIEEAGLEALSLRELGRRAGVSRGAPYYYFSDKEVLVARVGELGFSRMGARIGEAVRAHRDPLEQLRAGLRAYVDFARDDWNFFHLMFSVGLKRDRTHSDSDSPSGEYSYSSEAARNAFGILVHGIVDAQKAGLLLPGDPLLIVNVLWAFTHGIAVLARGEHLKHAGGVEPLFEAGLRALLDSYRPPPVRSRPQAD